MRTAHGSDKKWKGIMMNKSPDSSQSLSVTRQELFCAFLFMGLTSFGGVLPWARRMLVEERAWLTHDEFAEALSLGQVLPGPNIVNVSIMVGTRFQGVSGAICAFSGLMLAPFIIILLLAMLYTQYGHLDVVRSIFRGMGAATAGLVVAMGCRMAIKQHRSWRTVAMTALALVGSGVLRWPLLMVLAILVPISIGLTWGERK